VDDLNASSLNASMISEFSTDTVVQKKVNLRKKFVNGANIQNILTKHDDESIILFFDSKNNIWELVRRDDLAMNAMRNPEKLMSVLKKNENRLFNIEIKDNMGDTSLNTSYINTKNDFNLSVLMKD